jgi:hypothetical protein
MNLKMVSVLPLFFLFAPVSGLAGDATQPVKAIMDLAQRIWVPGANIEETYFDAAHITYFSKGFAERYHEAEKHPATDTESGTGDPFDYDVMTGGQDGCELKDVTLSADVPVEGKTPVRVSFNNTSCMEDEEPGKRTRLTFLVTEENGRPVIDDVIRESDDAEDPAISLRDEMDAIIEGQ